MSKRDKIWLSPPLIDNEAGQLLTEALQANWITTGGPYVENFESELKRVLNTSKDVVALNSGTSALHLALTLAGVQQGDFVLCQTMTYVASANPIAYLGAIPVFIDSEKNTYNLSPDYLKEAIEFCLKKGKKPAALIVVHSYGIPCELEELIAIAKEFEIPIIEDAAEALGSTYNKTACGLFGDFGILSFNGNKMITTGGGGALICKSNEDAIRARHLATQAKTGQAGFEHDAVGFNYAMPGLNAALGYSQLNTLEERVIAKRKIHLFYKEIFETIEGVELLEVTGEKYYANHWLNIIRFNAEIFESKSPEKLLEYLEKQQIESRFPWKPMHLQGIYKNQQYFGEKVAENLWQTSLCLPSGVGMTETEMQRIKEALIVYFHE